MSEFHGTPHNTAEYGQIAKTVIMPGDPLRAKMIAEKYLEDARQFNEVRGMLGYTGTYKGKPVSVMGHGMGIPSMAIYSYELFHFYDVEQIIRVGSCGGYLREMDLFDIVLVEGAYSSSSFARTAYGYKEDLFFPDPGITRLLEKTAEAKNRKIYKGLVNSGDAFYYDPACKENPPYTVIAGEMESFALFANAKYLKKKAACILTISDKKDAVTTPQERQTAFTGMIEIALDAAVQL